MGSAPSCGLFWVGPRSQSRSPASFVAIGSRRGFCEQGGERAANEGDGVSLDISVEYPTMETGVTHRGWVTRAPTGERVLRVELTHNHTDAEQTAFDAIVTAALEAAQGINAA